MDAGALGIGSPALALSVMAANTIRVAIEQVIAMSMRNIFVLFSARSKSPSSVRNYIQNIGHLSIFLINKYT